VIRLRIAMEDTTAVPATLRNETATKSVTKPPPVAVDTVARVAKEVREDITMVLALVDTEATVARVAKEVKEDTMVLVSSKKMPDVKSFVTSMTYLMVHTTTLEALIVTKGSFTKFVLKGLAGSDIMVAREEKVEREDTTAVTTSVDTEASVVTVAKVERDRRVVVVVVVSSFKNVLPSVHSHHHNNPVVILHRTALHTIVVILQRRNPVVIPVRIALATTVVILPNINRHHL